MFGLFEIPYEHIISSHQIICKNLSVYSPHYPIHTHYSLIFLLDSFMRLTFLIERTIVYMLDDK